MLFWIFFEEIVTCTERFRKCSLKCSPIFMQSFELMEFYSDGCKECKKLETELGLLGIENLFSALYTPELNVIAEQVDQTLSKAARALLVQGILPECSWPFALRHIVNVQNMVLDPAIPCTLFEVIHDDRPILNHVRMFEHTAYLLLLSSPSSRNTRAAKGVKPETLSHVINRV